MIIALAMIFALVVWWASTVLIIYLDGLKPHTFKYSLAGATVVLGISLWGLSRTATDPTLTGAYLAFTAGLFAWGWQEVSFYMGFVTGPRKTPCPEGCRGWKHFGHAIQTSLYHELAIIASAVLVVTLTWDEPDQIGMWTFLILWWMHQSAKLNVFLGVRNLNEEFLPEHLTFLKGFLNKRAMNLLFPFSVTISTVLTVIVARKAFATDASAFQQAGYSFLTGMMALAILEHWMLVLPMPAGTLWKPGLRSRGATRPFTAEIVVGFLGAGKTTFLKRLLAQADPDEKTVVLVNDFGELGLDAGLLDGQGADVVELPNGCICCSLRGDVTTRLRRVLDDMAPERVLIEPSGVADVASLVSVLETPELKPFVRETRLWTVIDASAFLNDYGRLHDYFEIQARLAPVFVVNKTDLVSTQALDAVVETLTALNPDAEILPARHGIADAELIQRARPLLRATAPGTVETHSHNDAAHADDHQHSHAPHGVEGLGFENMSIALNHRLVVDELRPLLDRIAQDMFGHIERLKGLVEGESGWLKFDIAGGRVTVTAHVARPNESARVMIIGTNLARDALVRAFSSRAKPVRPTADLAMPTDEDEPLLHLSNS